MNARTYRAAMKRLAAADDALDRALDALIAARAEGRTIDVTPARLAAREAENAADEALNAAHQAHREYFREKARELRDAINAEAVPLLIAWRHAAKLTGDPVTVHCGVLTHDMDRLDDGVPPDLAADVPTDQPQSPALDKAEEHLW